MAEAVRTLSLLRQEMLVTDEVLGALSRCQSGTKLDADARNGIKEALVLLQGEEEKLARAREAVNVHQRLHADVEALRRQVRSEERRVQDCARHLTEADSVLRGPLQDAKRILEAGRQAEAAEVKVRDVVDYAQRISGITSAPSYWKPGMAMVGFAPPAPRPEMMRAGALSAFADALGNSLPADDLLRLVQDLDRPPRKTSQGTAGQSVNGVAGTDDLSSQESEKDEKGGRSSFNSTNDRKKGGKRRTAEGDEESVATKLGRETSLNFARQDPPKRPKISLDLDDLDSDSEEDDE